MKVISISVDPKVELLSAVELLAGWERIIPYKYTEGMSNYFKPYRNHPSVNLFKELRDFRYDAPVRFVLNLGTLPALLYESKPSEDIVKRAGSFDKLELFRNSLIDFYRDAAFEEFWNENSLFYSTVEKKARQEISAERTITSFEEYYGVNYDVYALVLSPATTGNYGGQNEKKVSAVFGVRELDSNIPLFDNKIPLFHELSHNVINPLTSQFIGQLKNAEALFNKVKEPMSKMHYNNLETVINEMIIRACDIKVNFKGNEEYSLNREENQGFLYIRPVFEVLNDYENNRNRYERFSDFYPKIMSLLDSLAN